MRKYALLQGIYSSKFAFMLVTPSMLFPSELPPAIVLHRYIINVSNLAFRITEIFTYLVFTYFAKLSTLNLKSATTFKHSVLNE